MIFWLLLGWTIGLLTGAEVLSYLRERKERR